MSEAADRDAYFEKNPLLSDRDYIVDAFRKSKSCRRGRSFMTSGKSALARADLGRRGARDARICGGASIRHPARLCMISPIPNGRRAFSATCTRTFRKRRASSMHCCRRRLFVEEFILDRTLDPAIDEFGYSEVRLLDPACGSGHFLLGAFARLLQAADAP